MASIKTLERQIGTLEGFDVVVLHPDGRDVRSDLGTGSSGRSLPSYPFQKAARGNMTVSDWIQGRFWPTYSGWRAEVLFENGEPARGNVLLSNVRASYEDD